jgi:hypothetical protein
MTNYRIFRLDNAESGSVYKNINSLTPGAAPTGSTGFPLSNVWGVIKEHPNATAEIRLEGGGYLNGNHMTEGTIYPCYPIGIRVTSGSFSLLS